MYFILMISGETLGEKTDEQYTMEESQIRLSSQILHI